MKQNHGELRELDLGPMQNEDWAWVSRSSDDSTALQDEKGSGELSLTGADDSDGTTPRNHIKKVGNWPLTVHFLALMTFDRRERGHGKEMRADDEVD